MIIHLHEIPTEGKSWKLTNKTGELNLVLEDLIGTSPFLTEFTITPMSPGTFHLEGYVKSETPETCSRCSLDFQFQVDEKFNELLMPALDTPRDGHFAKVNHYSDSEHQGPEVVEYHGNQFNVGEYIHEVVGLAKPMIPVPEADEQGNCVVCKINLQNHSFGYDEPMESSKASPFEVLKKMSIKKT